jgi:adenylate cyclase
MIEGRLDMPFRDLGLRQVKNINRPIRVWAWGSDAETTSAVDKQERTSIVVLPFINMSGDSEQEYFTDGIAEDIGTDLTKVSGLFVIARNSAFTYKGKLVNAKQVSEDLGVRYVLKGSVRKAPNRVRITAQLIDGTTGGQVWADRYDRDLTDIFAVQDEIAHSIVDALRVQLLTRESRAIRRIPTTSVEAYQFYLRGRQFIGRHSTKSYEYARRMFQRAIQLDPDYAQAYAGVADCDAFRCLMHSEVALDDVIAASDKALNLDPDLAEAHASRGLALSLGAEYDAASDEFEWAIRLNPDLYEAHYFYARSCVLQGKHEEAAKHYKHAAEVAPDDFQSLGHLAQEYHALGRESDALRAERESLERAEHELERHPDNVRAACYGAMSLVFLGELSRAQEWAERALWLDPDDPQALYNIACVHARLGAHDKAFELLARALRDMHPRMAAWARNDDDFASIREDPRFDALLEAAQHPPAK